MSVHIEAKTGEIADKILLPGDPLRAKYIAETFLENPVCYNQVRGMLGYTGTYKGERVSVQGTGMGMPSASIYAQELIQSYGVKKLIRVGTCGAISKDVHVRDSEDTFYKDDMTETLQLAELGVMGVEMEAAALYYLGAKFHVQTLAICTVSDHIVTGEETTAAERQTTFNDMMTIGLETLIG